MKEIIWFLVVVVLLGVIADLLQPTKKRKGKRKRTTAGSRKKPNPSAKAFNRSSKTCRPDEVILVTTLDDLKVVVFDRQLTLYFRYQGYKSMRTVLPEMMVNWIKLYRTSAG